MTTERSLDNSVVIFGLGYVGLTLAVAMAERNLKVIGIEVRADIVKSIQNGVPHFYEPTLDERLKNVIEQGRFMVYQYLPERCHAAAFVITVGTPLDTEGRVRLDMISNVARDISRVLTSGSLVVLRSTVKVGTTRAVIKPILDEAGVPYHLTFCPERTLEGKALQEIVELPQIVGGETLDAIVEAEKLFQHLTPVVIRVSSLETAEMVKLVDNTWRDIIFAYANEVAKICNVVGANAMEVINAGKKGYSRTNVPLPGLVGGPCLSKDSYILKESVELSGIYPNIIMTARAANENQPAEVVAYLGGLMNQLGSFPSKLKVALLGLAFKGKPATNDLRGTMAIAVIAALRAQWSDLELVGYDSLVEVSEFEGLGIGYASSLEEAVSGASLVFILNNHCEFEDYAVSRVTDRMADPAIVYDFWNTMDIRNTNFAPNAHYVTVGSHKLCEQKMGIQAHA